MGLLDIIRGKKKRKADEKLKRPPKGAFKTPKSKVAEKVAGGVKEGQSELASEVILSPHITEKAILVSEESVFVFRVSPEANKILIKKAIKELYGLEPIKIRITNMPAKLRFSRGKQGRRPGYKKAMVYFKKGDKIDIT
ncbi:MAG: 50S ribosomal protein L23 [Candidatus Tagabacteria bacterium CG09_land_8_20_14_0_10_41_14]|uniref:Large ribosomal subunit protein uL23 n=2 Tax=Candidatus Tagaibacteriota TaxID=1817918 RepID=A0A2H0WLF4_9BACT|nr:MAG: 50S ribosomal protein L23 [Candidatus Tagabacteria bacterium CG09_land_8_20_14_0_10_41_14]PJE73142.1 MAG: 50S ribosomal protein L23 [Candidatus Tagabacteria bacterium CG10_big_fil_rev_8_21_14_0_10_40_13]